VGDVVRAVDGWRNEARAAGLGRGEIERMEPAFEHKQRDLAAQVIGQP
jgi:hypothetical protein